ncbi:MAG: hypothetical protein GY786_20420, partial [Proteobacteria bacterium]|nr:hypothetical protein [Pseudomonadota bacterium]
GKNVFEPGSKIKDCEGIAENAVLFFTNKLDQPVLINRKSGEFDLSGFVPDNVTNSKGIYRVFLSLFKPDKTELYGGKRLKDSESLPGFPGGEILLPDKSLSFSTSDAVQGKMRSFALYEMKGNAKPIFSTNQVNKKIKIPITKLSHDTRYKWTAQSSEKSYSGVFTIAHQEDQQEFEDELQISLSKSDPSTSTRHLLRAVLAKEYGYTFDMRQSI